MSTKIVNAKQLHTKAKQHQVITLNSYEYRVISGTSKNAYIVRLVDRHSATCSCEWGGYRKAANGKRSACSHVQAVMQFTANTVQRSTAAWASEEAAKRQKRHMLNLGDGVTMTTRKKAKSAQAFDEAQALRDLGF